jgi:hypothetical protein
MTITEEQMAGLERLLDGVYAGPWHVVSQHQSQTVIGHRTVWRSLVYERPVAELVVAVRNALPDLIAALRQARADEQRWRARVKTLEAREQMAVDVLSGKVAP